MGRLEPKKQAPFTERVLLRSTNRANAALGRLLDGGQAGPAGVGQEGAEIVASVGKCEYREGQARARAETHQQGARTNRQHSVRRRWCRTKPGGHFKIGARNIQYESVDRSGSSFESVGVWGTKSRLANLSQSVDSTNWDAVSDG